MKDVKFIKISSFNNKIIGINFNIENKLLWLIYMLTFFVSCNY
jgi:hypothetical protein